MTKAGDIHNGPYATRAKEYVWSSLTDGFPRGITPTDIDGLVEINWCFFAFEGKTVGKQIDKGQGQALRRLVLSLPESHAVIVVGEHSSMEKADVMADLKTLTIGYRQGRDLVWLPKLPGCLANVAQLFARDAKAGRLQPATWYGECVHAMRPFDDDPLTQESTEGRGS